MQAHRSIVLVLALAAGGLVVDRAEAASQLALDFPRAFERAPNADSNYGWAFTLSAPITIDGLGLWDAGSNGLIEPHPVGIWRTSGPTGAPVLLTSEDVSNNDSVPMSSASPDGRWLFSTIATLTLDSGSYIIGALYHAGSPGVYDPFASDALSISTVPGLTYGSTREVHSTQMLTCPTDFGLNEHNGFFGPNFRAVVPEPSSAMLLAATSSLIILHGRPRGQA